jgi:Tfp pilus assembly protein PilZ
MRLAARIATLDPVQGVDQQAEPYFLFAVAATLDLAEGGVGLCTECTLEPGQRVLVELQLPGERLVERRGRVVWAAPTEAGLGRLGIQFDDADDGATRFAIEC